MLRTILILLLAIVLGVPVPLAAQGGNDQDEEVQLGQQVFDELKDKGVIVESSPLYDILQPITAAIIRAAQPQYNHPFKFYLVHDTQPNAFAAPGGNVYVVDSLLYFVRNREELAGTLCHEVSHTIHHDSMVLMEKQRQIMLREIGAVILLNPNLAQIIAINMIGKLSSLRYSRDEESRADLTGSGICAAAGYNPWGLVWLFNDFQNADPNQVPQVLSDHPGNQTRIDALEKHFRKNPSVFGRFSSDEKTAVPIVVPKDTSEVFMR